MCTVMIQLSPIPYLCLYISLSLLYLNIFSLALPHSSPSPPPLSLSLSLSLSHVIFKSSSLSPSLPLSPSICLSLALSASLSIPIFHSLTYMYVSQFNLAGVERQIISCLHKKNAQSLQGRFGDKREDNSHSAQVPHTVRYATIASTYINPYGVWPRNTQSPQHAAGRPRM